jgi:hypothetical protein
MADATPRTYIFGLIAFVFVIVGGLSIVGVFAGNNPAMVTGSTYSDFNSSFNKFNEVNSEVGSIQNGLVNENNDFGAYGVLNSLMNGAWQSLRLLGTSLGFMTTVYGGLATVFGVPAWIPTLIGLFFIAILAFTIWSAIFRSEI